MENYRPITLWNEDDRPREKLISKGRSALSDAELIAILVGTGSIHRDVFGNKVNKTAVDLGKDVMYRASNSLLSLSRLSVAELMQVPGIGEAKAVSVIAALELGARRKVSREEKTRISSSRDAWELLSPHVSDLHVEEFWMILLNRANLVLRLTRLSQGGITGTVVDTVALFKQALLENAKGIILCHNHPSGSTQPSPEDISITRRIQQAGKLLDIHIHDHIIVTAESYYSFADSGQL